MQETSHWVVVIGFRRTQQKIRHQSEHQSADWPSPPRKCRRARQSGAHCTWILRLRAREFLVPQRHTTGHVWRGEHWLRRGTPTKTEASASDTTVSTSLTRRAKGGIWSDCAIRNRPPTHPVSLLRFRDLRFARC